MEKEMVKVYIALLCEREADEFKTFADFYGKEFCVSTNLHAIFANMSQFAVENGGCEYSLWEVEMDKNDIGKEEDQQYINRSHPIYQEKDSEFLFFGGWLDCCGWFTMNKQEKEKYSISMLGNFNLKTDCNADKLNGVSND